MISSGPPSQGGSRPAAVAPEPRNSTQRVTFRVLKGSSLQTRLMLAVSVLALAAVGAVALSARQWTRIEFRKFQALEQRRPAATPATRASDVASLLAGRCCAAGSMDGAAARLGAAEALVVVDGQGGLIAAAGPGAAALQAMHTSLEEGVLRVDAVSVRRGVSEAVTLQFRGQPASRITTTDGRQADV